MDLVEFKRLPVGLELRYVPIPSKRKCTMNLSLYYMILYYIILHIPCIWLWSTYYLDLVLTKVMMNCCLHGNVLTLDYTMTVLHHRSAEDDSVLVILHTLTYSTASQSPQKQNTEGFSFLLGAKQSVNFVLKVKTKNNSCLVLQRHSTVTIHVTPSKEIRRYIITWEKSANKGFRNNANEHKFIEMISWEE